MKGQMFILTMVFLVGLIFAVQSLLISYNVIDLSEPIQGSDNALLLNIANSVQDTVEGTDACSDVRGNLDELETSLNTGMLSFYDIDINHEVICSRWENQPPDNPPVSIEVSIKKESSETMASYSFYHNVTG